MSVQQSSTPQPSKQAPIPIFLNSCIVGYVTGRAFRKTIAGSRHLLRRPPAICFDLSVLDAAERAGATVAVVYDRETKTTYMADIATIRSRGFPVIRRYGRQWGLPLELWTVDGEPPRAVYRGNQERTDAQPSLFGEVDR